MEESIQIPNIEPMAENEIKDIISSHSVDAWFFESYKQTGQLLWLAVHALINTDTDPDPIILTRDQSIIAGLIARSVKFMIGVIELTHPPGRGEIIMALNRPIIESIVNARYLMLKNDPEVFDKFVLNSLGPERELHDITTKNIHSRGHSLVVEERVLDSIYKVVSISDLDIVSIPRTSPDWGGDLRQRMEAIGMPQLYSMAYRISTHAIHGTWVDLVLNHLTETNGKFTINESHTPQDTGQLWPIAYIALDAGFEYLNTYDIEPPNDRRLSIAIKTLQSNIMLVANELDDPKPARPGQEDESI